MRQAERPRLAMVWWRRALVVGGLCSCVVGCRDGSSGNTETEAKTRLTKVLRLYQAFVQKTNKGPKSEQELRDFGQQLTPKEREDFLLGDDLESIFTSPRDNQPFVIKYNIKLSPSGAARAVAWEAQGENGRRYIALSMGYVEEYGEAMFKEYTK